MILVDKPLEELKKYNGTNEKPNDFFEYWERGLKQMRAVDPCITIKKSQFQAVNADCYDMYFTGVLGARVYAKLLKPKNLVNKAPAVLQFHGYGCNSGDWQSKLSFVGMGFVVIAMDCRGQGYSEDTGSYKNNTRFGQLIRGIDNENPDDLLFRNIFLDTAQLAKIVMNMDDIDENKVCAMGNSQGGGLTIACGSLEPKIKKLAPAISFLADYERVWDLGLTKDAYDDIEKYFRWYDPNHKKHKEFFYKLGYIDVQHLADRIEGDVLFTVALSDTMCPPSTQFAIYNKITAKKELVLYPDFGHENLPYQQDNSYEFISKIL